MSDATPRWAWSASARRYRENGRFVTKARFDGLRDAFLAEQEGRLLALSRSLADGGMTLRAWESEVAERLTSTFTAEYMAARGGRNAMGPADRRAIGRMMKTQRRYLRGFAEAIARGELTAAAIERRVVLYARSSRQAFERGRAAGHGVRLPAYPADGSSECKANDRCRWEIESTPTRVKAYWRLSAAEHCDTCTDRARRWSPYVVDR